MAGADRDVVADPTAGTPVRFGEFEFCPDSGTLTRSGESAGIADRMAPKPAALLAMLLERRGRLVSRREIRQQLWSDVTVDFENSLNYCVRQVRQALDDSASTPRYVETVPGRGYRLRPELFAPEAVPVPPAMSRRVWIGACAVAAALGVGGWLLSRGDRPARLRIAILPFADPTMSPGLALRCRQLEARVLADLTLRSRGFADVVGPRTTGPMVDEGTDLPRIAAALGANHVVNARFIGETPKPEILFELIRSSDGAHVYVKRASDLVSVDALAETIISGMLAALEAERAGS